MILVCTSCGTHWLWRRSQRRLRKTGCPECGGRLRRFRRAGDRPDPDRPAFPLRWRRAQRIGALQAILRREASTFGDRRWASAELDRLERLPAREVAR